MSPYRTSEESGITPQGPVYRGHLKHKSRPAKGAKGTLCPEWTHRTPTQGLANDMQAHDWPATIAAALFRDAEICEETKRRYATARGIAFEAKPTNDGTWHGYPIPWEHVPSDIRTRWLANKRVLASQIKKYLSFAKDDIHWALQTDSFQ